MPKMFLEVWMWKTSLDLGLNILLGFRISFVLAFPSRWYFFQELLVGFKYDLYT